MTGMSNYAADASLGWVGGLQAMPALASRYLALFTAVGTDAGTGFTEVSGGSYARVQVAGSVATSASTSTSSATLTFSSTPAWIVPGMSVFDTTTPGAITGGQTVQSVTGTTVVLTADVNATVNSGDSIAFSAWPLGTGTAPSSTTNGGAITFAQATASWGTVIAWGIYDALTSGNFIEWDFLGNFQWLPFEAATASGNTLQVKANGFSSNDPIVFTNEYGGTLPTVSTGTLTGYTVNFVASPATDTIQVDTTSGPTTPIVLTSTGSGMLRKIVQQSIPSNVTASFAASQLTITSA